MYDEILSDLSQGHLALTANLRLSALLRKEYDQFHRHRKQQVWPSANILPIHTWIIKLWQEINCNKLLLSDFQENQLWQKIINEDRDQLPLVHLSNTAQLIQQAWALLHQWQINIEDFRETDSEDVQFFYHWSKRFRSICQQQQLISQAELAEIIQQKIADIKNEIPKMIYLIGFDELPPAMKNLLSTLQTKTNPEILIKFYQLKPRRAEISQIKLADAYDEIVSMAQWAKKCYLKNPHGKIACVVPDLGHIRNKVSSIFTQIFCIENLLPDIEHTTLPFNISAGLVLSQFPFISHALHALELCCSVIKVKTLSEILQSPYFYLHPEDKHCAALMDLAIRDFKQEYLTYSQWLPICDHFIKRFPKSTWLTRWRALEEFVAALEERQSPLAWSQTFSSLLKIMGWPGSRTLDSQEYQLMMRWQQLFDEFIKLDWFVSELNIIQALQAFKSLVAQTIFQSQGSDVSIQILGILETAGHQFDQMWIMGLHDEAWPPVAKPNPFIPYSIQIAQQMPHASADRELSYTQQLLQRLFSSAHHIILSSPQQQADKKLQASRLMSYYPMITKENLGINAQLDNQQIQNSSQKIEFIQDNQAPSINSNERIRGGSRVLKLQACCPFRAFATLRLQAEPMIETQMGINAAERGILVHRVLENVWNELKNQANLKALNEIKLGEVIEKQINDVFMNHPILTEKDLDNLFLELEKQRLYTLIFEWLRFEKQRPPFTVTAQEIAKTVQIGQLKLNIQIDRIDRLTDGSEFIIDYKTGNCSVSDWFGERLRDPQLPIYCVYGDDKPNAGIGFAVLQPGKTQFKGLISEKYPYADYPIVGVKSETITWQQRTILWREALTALANDFVQGKASVDPVDATACRYCELQPLCRVAECN